jgi:putative phosphoesterase
VRIAVISDTHMRGGTARRLPHRCVELIAASDLVVHAGDIMTPETLIEIEAIGPPVRAVVGNMDGWDLRARLPETDVIDVEGATLAVIHDAGPSAGRLERMRRRFPHADAVVFGHSHLPLHAQADDFQIFNPGSPTERRRAPTHSMGLAHARDGRIEFELVTLQP